MLSEILSKETCAECRFCCVFRRQSLWETPLLSEEFMRRYTKGADGSEVRYRKYLYMDDGTNVSYPEKVRPCGEAGECGAGIPAESGMIYGQTELSHLYRTVDSEEEVPCPFLDEKKGCILPEEDKPFDCKIWPLRLMREVCQGDAPDDTLSAQQNCVSRCVPLTHLAVCLTPTCPAVNKLPVSRVRELVEKGLGDKIFARGEKEPYMVKDYREGYIVLLKK